MIIPSPTILGPKTSWAVRDALKNTPWEEVRPGVYERETGHEGVRYRERRWDCQVCHEDFSIMCMIHDELWHQIAPDDGMMCIACMEKKLGRRITTKDLRAKFNNPDLKYLLDTRNDPK